MSAIAAKKSYSQLPGVTKSTMKIFFIACLLFVLSSASYAGELERFWSDFPGFDNSLAAYGYGRNFASSVKPEFVDDVVRELADRPSEKRLAEYINVIYFMDQQIVSARLASLESKATTRVMRSITSVRERLDRLRNEHKK